MASNKFEYRSDIFKIAGFSLMTPLGRIVIEPIIVLKEFGSIGFIVFIVISLTLLLFGIILIMKGYEALEKYE